MDWPKPEVIEVELKKLTPYARNSRTHDDAQIAQIAASIQEWGFTNPILVDENNMIVAGHGRFAAANRLELKTVPCIMVDGWTDAQKRAYVIADNKLALNAGWDDQMLALELEELQLDFEIEKIGFDIGELNKIFSDDLHVETPEDFNEYDEEIETDKMCPKCGYEWSGGE